MLVGKMTSLILPVHELGGGNRYGLIPKVLDRRGHNQSNRVQQDIDSLIMLKLKRGRLFLDPIHNGIGKVIPNGYG